MMLSIPEVAQIIGVSRETAYRMAKASKLPAVRYGRNRYAVLREDLDRWLAERGTAK